MAKKPLAIEALKHDAKRLNIPTAEFESLMRDEEKSPVQVAYERRNRDLDPQLVWRGKDEQDWSDLIVQAPPLFIQEKLHPKQLVDDLKRQTKLRAQEKPDTAPDLFADFNGLPDKEAVTEFYQHDLHWANRMVLGDSMAVMASLAEREGLRGQVQCIYFDPPYGIKFNSNFQWSTRDTKVADGKKDHLTREPEQVRAFRDTWHDGIHSYLTYIRDRLTVARDLLAPSGSMLLQIGDENVHRVRAVMDEIFGPSNFICAVIIQKTGSLTGEYLQSNSDTILWYGKDKSQTKYRSLFTEREGSPSKDVRSKTILERNDFSAYPLTSDGFRETTTVRFSFEGQSFYPGDNRHWGVTTPELDRVGRAGRLLRQDSQIRLKYFWDDYPVQGLNALWTDVGGATGKVYVVQTAPKVLSRLILMTTDPGDLVLDPTCGSGTTAYVAEQWGRRWITIDTSRVALALARSRLMGARYPFYVLADSAEGQAHEARLTRSPPKTTPTRGNVRLGFVYERVPHLTLKGIARNTQIDEIWADFEPRISAKRDELASELGKALEDWQIPFGALSAWSEKATRLHAEWRKLRIERQAEMDRSVAAKADVELLYDKPVVDTSRVRVAGPFTVESLSPHRTLAVGADDELIDLLAEGAPDGTVVSDAVDDFADMILKNLKAAGVQQAHKEDRIIFTSLVGWPGNLICAEGRYLEGEVERRAGVFIGPEFGTVSRPDLVAAAREAGDADFDVLIVCAFNYDAHASEFSKLGRVPVLRARMNPDLHMAGDLAATGAGNLFVVFGEPDIEIEDAAKDADGADLIRVKVSGVDVFKPQTGKVESEGIDGIALWMLDTDYNEESFFVRHAYFLGANDPYKALKTTLKAEVDKEAWASLNSDISRPFPKPSTGRIAVKVINHLGDEVMKVFEVR